MKDELTLQLMNTNFYIAVAKKGDSSWKQPITEWLQYVATQWSRFRTDNELAALNNLPLNQSMQLAPALYDCLIKAQYYYQITDGLFSPYLKKQLEQHGYAKSIEQTKASLTQATHIETPVHTPRPFDFLPDNTVIKKANVEVDLGGFAKGYAVEKAAQLLKNLGYTEYGLVNGGGDMTMWSAGEKVWSIGIADPYDTEKDVTLMKMKNGSIATSSRAYRCWTQGTTKKHHLLHGRTGEVANTPILQASVVTDSLCDAEVGAKMCFLLNMSEQEQWFEHYIGKTARYIIDGNENGQWHLTKGAD